MIHFSELDRAVRDAIAPAVNDYVAFLASGGERLKPRHTRALELATVRPGIQVLDVGCGWGELAFHVAQAGGHVTGVEISRDRLEPALQTLALGEDEVREHFHLSGANAVALPFEDATFDRVFLLDVAEHLWPWELHQALSEIRRVLRPGGYAVIHTVPHRWALDFGYPLLRLVWPVLPREPRWGLEKQWHVNELSLIELHRALRAAGLDARVWLESWTAAQAEWSRDRRFPDPVRKQTYPFLRWEAVRRLTSWVMHTPLRLILANDLFAIAWPDGARRPPQVWPTARIERGALWISNCQIAGHEYVC